MSQMKRNKENYKKGGFFLLQGKGDKTRSGGNNSRISAQLTTAIAYNRDPNLFDPKEIQERDRELLPSLTELKKKDEEFNLQRNNKPVLLTDPEAQIMYALAFDIGGELDSEDIKEIIENPFSDKEVVRTIDLNKLSLFLNGRTSKKERDTLRNRFFRLDSTFQITPIKVTDERGRERNFLHIKPFIRIKQAVVETTDSDEPIDAIKIAFGRAFFVGLKDRFAVLTPKIFEVWGKGKKGVLFHILLSSILSAYSRCYIAAKKIEIRLREENDKLAKDKRLDETSLKAKIEEQQGEAWRYELYFSSIKEKVPIDYDSTKQYRAKFKKDLQKTIADLQETELITERTQTIREKANGKTKKKQEGKVVFCLNPNYYKEERTPLPPAE